MASSMGLTSAQLRFVGNESFQQYKSATDMPHRTYHLHRALEWYEEALKTARKSDHENKAAATKNMGVCYRYLGEAEECFVTKMHYIKNAAKNFANALYHGEHCYKSNNWMNPIFEEMKKLIEKSSTLAEASLDDILDCVDKDIKMTSYHETIAQHRLVQAQNILIKCMHLIGERNFKTGLPMIHEVYRPLEEAKKHSKDISALVREATTLEIEYSSFLAVAEGLQAYYVGTELLEEALNSLNDERRFNTGILCLDQLLGAEALAKGEETEIVAMVRSKLGVVYLHAFSNTHKAKMCFLEAMQVSTTVVGVLQNRPWYTELTATMQSIRDEEERLENEKWENKRKPFLEELKSELELLQERRDDTADEIVEFLFKQFPPTHVKNATKPEMGGKKALLKLCQMYHPDKVDENELGTKYKVLCEEITKLITARYERMKGVD